MRKIVNLALAAAFALTTSASALADSKSAAEFTLATCLPAMDDLSKVEVMARENNWTPTPLPPPNAALSKFVKTNSMWHVVQGEDRFSVDISNSHFEPSSLDLNVCFVNFLNKNVTRKEFLNFISASLDLTFMFDTPVATYAIKGNPAKTLAIRSESDGDMILGGAWISQYRFVAPLPAPPAAPSEIRN